MCGLLKPNHKRLTGLLKRNPLAIEEVSPKKMLTDSLAMMDIPKKIQVKNKLKDNPTIKVDPDKVKRIFINLIKNSIDAMPEARQNHRG